MPMPSILPRDCIPTGSLAISSKSESVSPVILVLLLVDPESELDEAELLDVPLSVSLDFSFPLLFFLDFGVFVRLVTVLDCLSDSSSLIAFSPGVVLDLAFLLALRPFPRALPPGFRPLGTGGMSVGSTSTLSRGNASTHSSFTRYLSNRKVGVIPFVWRVYQNLRREWQWSSFIVDGSPRRDRRSDGRYSSSMQFRSTGTRFFQGIARSEPDASAMSQSQNRPGASLGYTYHNDRSGRRVPTLGAISFQFGGWAQ